MRKEEERRLYGYYIKRRGSGGRMVCRSHEGDVMEDPHAWTNES